MAKTDILHTEATLGTLTIGGTFGAIGLALMFGAGSLIYGGALVVVITCGLILYRNRIELADAFTGGAVKHIIVPLGLIIILCAGAGVLIYRKSALHPMTLQAVISETVSVFTAGAVRLATNPESWFVAFALWGFWLAIRRPSKRKPKPAVYGPDVYAGLAKLKGQIEALKAGKALEPAPMGQPVVLLPMRPNPALAQWAKALSYTIAEAACLWVDELPGEGISEEAEGVQARLIAAGLDKRFDVQLPDHLRAFASLMSDRMVNEKSRVKRADLISFAQSEGDHPRFLFPTG